MRRAGLSVVSVTHTSETSKVTEKLPKPSANTHTMG